VISCFNHRRGGGFLQFCPRFYITQSIGGVDFRLDVNAVLMESVNVFLLGRASFAACRVT